MLKYEQLFGMARPCLQVSRDERERRERVHACLPSCIRLTPPRTAVYEKWCNLLPTPHTAVYGKWCEGLHIVPFVKQCPTYGDLF